MSKKDLPGAPPAGRSNKGPGTAKRRDAAYAQVSDIGAPRRGNTEKEGRRGNIAANTRNQGYQQDR